MITVLSTHHGEKLTKTFTRTPAGVQKQNYAFAKLFDVDEEAVGSLEQLSECLFMLERNDSACIIRGRRRNNVDAEGIQRLSADQEGADGFFENVSRATFEDQPIHWVMIDIDKLSVDPDLTEAQRIAKLIEVLPAEFRGADFHIQWSSSAGLDGWQTLSAHLWFWLSEPATSVDLKRRAQIEDWKGRGIDVGLFQEVKIHYTAAPIFKNMDDPLADRRSRFVKLNRRVVTLPALPPEPEPPKIEPGKYRPNVRVDNPATEARVKAWVEAVIRRRCEDIVNASDGDQNETLYRASAMFGSLVAGALLDEAVAMDALTKAALAGAHPRGRSTPTIRSGLRRGKSNPIYGPPV